MGKKINSKVKLLVKNDSQQQFNTTSQDIRKLREHQINSKYLRGFFSIPQRQITQKQIDHPILHQAIEDSLRYDEPETNDEEETDEVKEIQLSMHKQPTSQDLLNKKMFTI